MDFEQSAVAGAGVVLKMLWDLAGLTVPGKVSGPHVTILRTCRSYFPETQLAPDQKLLPKRKRSAEKGGTFVFPDLTPTSSP